MVIGNARLKTFICLTGWRSSASRRRIFIFEISLVEKYRLKSAYLLGTGAAKNKYDGAKPMAGDSALFGARLASFRGRLFRKYLKVS